MVLFKDVEDTFYKFLKTRPRIQQPRWPFLIKVADVEGRIMTDATFNKRDKAKDGSDTYSATIYAKKAEMHFDLKERLVRSISTRPRCRTTEADERRRAH